MWPVSRAKAPKQFVPLLGKDNLFIQTLHKVKDKAAFAPSMVVGNAEHRFMIQDSLEESQLTVASVLLEPIGRNTAPAALAAALAEKDPDVLHLVCPSDHVIADEAAWRAAIAQAVPAAAGGALVLFGIKPSYPETGYGYIRAGAQTPHANVFAISAFKEKPDHSGAIALMNEGALWNSGIFMYAPKSLIDEARIHAPAMVDQIARALAAAEQTPQGTLLNAAVYETIAGNSIDYTIMEHTKRAVVVPCSVGWNDVGSWHALWQVAEKDADGNVKQGPVIAQDTKNSLIRSDGATVAILGMEDVAVIATKDAILVAPRSRTQDVKNLVAEVNRQGSNLAQDPHVARRPWGSYESIASGDRFQVKHIVVKPGRSLSLQMHHHRAEHWIVVEGTAAVQCGETEKLVFPNESVYIPKGEKHRLSNPGMIDLHLIEVQSGDYLGEDDIVRFADVYGRAKS